MLAAPSNSGRQRLVAGNSSQPLSGPVRPPTPTTRSARS
jgi:hypothetical protein